MANQWFRFKQFVIQQDQCAMKVGTDGVILGAWTDVKDASKALDIGTGTGLLALMLAQRSKNIYIEAIEIEEKSAGQAASNFSSSIFSDRIRSINVSFDDHCMKLDGPRYDLIICNPPYFSSSLKAAVKERSLARHDDSLRMEDLFKGVAGIMLPSGKFCLILPADQLERSIAMAELSDLYPTRILNIKPTPGKEAKRICLEYRFKANNPEKEILVIEEGGRHQYSAAYKALTKDFYLEF